MTWVALLRGTNVSRQRPVPMARLRETLEASGSRGVRTYLQRGNVLFTAALGPDELAEAIEAIRREFGFDVPVILRSATQWKKLVAANPFLAGNGVDSAKWHVTFLAAEPDAAASKSLAAPTGSADAFRMHGLEIYLNGPNGCGRTKLTNAFFERKLGVGATPRNRKTVMALADRAAE